MNLINANRKKKETEWEERIKSLEDQIKYWSENEPKKTIETVELYYDQDNKIIHDIDEDEITKSDNIIKLLKKKYIKKEIKFI